MTQIHNVAQMKQVAEEAGYPSSTTSKSTKVEAAFKIYQHALGAVDNVAKNAVLVAGRHGAKNFSLPAIRGEKESDHHVGSRDIQIIFPNIVSGHRLWDDFGTMGDEGATQGSILNTKNWSLLANDAWILGGVQSGKKFLVVSPLSWYNLMEMVDPQSFRKIPWSTWLEGASPADAGVARQIMTVTAREMLGLSHFGYRIDRMGPEIITGVPDGSARIPATFKDYRAMAERYGQNPGEVWEFFRTLETNLTFHASAHLLVRDGKGKEEVTTAEEEIDKHPGEKKILGQYDLQGALLEETKPGSYAKDDLQRDLQQAAGNLAAEGSHFDLRGASFERGVQVPSLNAKKAELYLACLQNTGLAGADLTGADLRATDFFGADLSGLVVTDAKLSNAPVLLAQPFPGRSDMAVDLNQEFIFFQRAILFHYRGGRVSLAANPDGTGEVYTDDKIEVRVTPLGDVIQGKVGRTKTFAFDYSKGNSGRIWNQQPQGITDLFATGPGDYLVSLKLIDLYHNSYGSSGYYLVA